MESLTAWIRELVGTLAGLVLPAECAGCGAAHGSASALCTDCRPELGGPAGLAWPTPAPSGLPPPFAVAAYSGVVKAAIIAHKEHGRAGLAKPLGRALARALTRALEPADLGGPPVGVVPMPSSPAAVRRRGHDPTGRLARVAVSAVRRNGRSAVLLPVLRQSRSVIDQAGLSYADRWINLAGAMIVPRRHEPLVDGREIVLVDDVLTTGATLAEAARALRQAGSEIIGAAVVAATERRHRVSPDRSTEAPYPSPPDAVSVSGMAPARVRGCAESGHRTTVVDLGKPKPAAGEAAHVRRLFVVRSRCGLGVSPAPPEVQMSSVPGEGG